MSNSACNCHETPPSVVPAFSLKFDVRSCSHCGFLNLSDGKAYAIKVEVWWHSATNQWKETTSSASGPRAGAECVITSSTRNVGSGPSSTTYSSEVTDCTLPEWDGYDIYGNYYSPHAEYTRYITQKEEMRCEWKVADHRPIPTCYLKLWLRKIIQTTEGYGTASPVTTTTYEDTTTEWTGEGTPCFADPTKSIEDSANLVKQETPYVLQSPTPEGLIDNIYIRETISIKKYSYLPGYTPNDPDEYSCQGKKPSGFPCPTCPDCDPPAP